MKQVFQVIEKVAMIVLTIVFVLLFGFLVYAIFYFATR